MKVSVIIPVYNKEDFLDECLGSVTNQLNEQMEIIVINDGSTDNSEKIIKKWMEVDSRLNYFYQDNQGVAAARNKGISIAKGSYIYFLDADDKLKENAISIFMKYAKQTDADIIIGNNYERRSNHLIKKYFHDEKLIKNENLLAFDMKLDMFMINGRPMAMAGNKLYKTDFIKSNNIYFVENVIAEDRLFNLICYLNNPIIKIIPEYTYIYNVFDGSRSRTVNNRYTEESISLFAYLYNYIHEKELLNVHSDLLQLILMYDVNKIISYTIRYSDRKIVDTIRAIKKLKRHPLVSKFIPTIFEDHRFIKVKSRNFKRLYYNSLLFYYAPFLLVLYKKLGVIYQKVKR